VPSKAISPSCTILRRKISQRYRPAHNYFLSHENQIRTYGSFGNRGNRRQIPQVQAEVYEETEAQVLAYVQINPRSSIRHIANEVRINPRKVQKI